MRNKAGHYSRKYNIAVNYLQSPNSASTNSLRLSIGYDTDINESTKNTLLKETFKNDTIKFSLCYLHVQGTLALKSITIWKYQRFSSWRTCFLAKRHSVNFLRRLGAPNALPHMLLLPNSIKSLKRADLLPNYGEIGQWL